jgi:hypothetical protein
MRKRGQWRKELQKDLTAYAETMGQLPMSVAQFLDVELVLTLMAEYLPLENPQRAWALLGGNLFPALVGNEVALRAIAICRIQLPRALGRGAWERQLKAYIATPTPFPLYQIEQGRIVKSATALLAERLEVMKRALEVPPSWEKRVPRWAPPGTYRFTIGQETHSVEIPAGAISKPQKSQFQPRKVPRLPISVTFDELCEVAKWMDKMAPAGSAAAGQKWYERMADFELEVVLPQGIQRSDRLEWDGLLHLVGKVGAGKTSLIIILTVYLARQGLRAVIVQSDVASLLALADIFAAYNDERLLAVPLVGKGSRLVHLNRLHVSEAQRYGLTPTNAHPAYDDLSTICPLDGFRRDKTPIPIGQEPCTKLEPVDGTGSQDCPLMPKCPVHAPTRRLANALIWLATPASLLASNPQVALVEEQGRYVEFVLRYADVVLIDEADLVQIQFDDRFAPMEVLVGREDAWLDRLAPQVARQIYRPGRPLVGRRTDLDRWLIAHTNTQRAIDSLYTALRESATTRRWIGQTYFSGKRLLQRLEKELASLGGQLDIFSRASEAFTNRGLRVLNDPKDAAHLWALAVQRELFGADSEGARLALSQWLGTSVALDPTIKGARLDELSHRLLLGLVVSVADLALQEIVDEWATASEWLDLDRGAGGLFYHPSDDLVRLVPEPAMGAVLGFQYFDNDDDGDGELRFFHVRGAGRSLLLHLHDALERTDGIAGPHVLLTSGTSWAPASWRYHLVTPPHALIAPKKRPGQIYCFFDPLPDPAKPGNSLFVSGKQHAADRIATLRVMVDALGRPGALTKESRFDREIARISDPERERILLVVGSYEEARAVEEQLRQILGGVPGEHVLALVPDSEGELGVPPLAGLLRGMVAGFSSKNARFLVAPLLAIERGHNILVGQKAAIGSVYFLTRPIPIPGDPRAAIHRMNRWADQRIPELIEMSATAAGQTLRDEARTKWDELLQQKESYVGAVDPRALLWTQIVLVWQCIGRLLRGGVGARVHFVDAKWAPVTSGLLKGDQDTPATSMLLGFEQILSAATTDPDPSTAALAKALYGPFLEGLQTIEGVDRV